MRTVVLFGLLAVADAINKNWASDKVAHIYAIVILVAIFMDIMDFINSFK